MPLPMSKSQVRKLGRRLRDPGPPGDEDLDQLNLVLSAYDEALNASVTTVTDLGLDPAYRLKNAGTIVEKLRRGTWADLASIQDLAGLRIVLPPQQGRGRQDEVRDLVVAALSTETHVARVYDRRANPSHGYRAVHVVAESLELPVELQIRTALQHEWAQSFEKLADEVGRGIRYGGEADTLVALLADDRFDDSREALRGAVDTLIDTALGMADSIDRYERLPSMPPPAGQLTGDLMDQLLVIVRTSTEAARAIMDHVRTVLAS